MPNWCSSFISIEDVPEKIDVIEKELNKALSSEIIPTDFGSSWLGNLLLHVGMDKDEVVYGEVRCRGYVIDTDRVSDSQLTMHTESAWCPHITCVQKFVSEYSDTAEIIYIAEEYGNGLFWTNDPTELDVVYCNYYDLPEEYSTFFSNDKTQDFSAGKVEEFLKQRFGNLTWRELVDKVQDDIGDGHLEMCRYELVPIGEDT